jgi:hypothetical protein
MDDTAELATLLRSFDVTAPGSGDPIVGVNLLACMACTLANLAPDDGWAIHPDGSPARLGTSLLMMGSASTGRVVDEIITEVVRRQNNLIGHVASYFEHLERPKGTPGFPPPPEPVAGASLGLVEETQSQYGDMIHGLKGSWRKVLESTPHQTIRQIRKQPKFLVSVGGRKCIESQLIGLRPGFPLVHLGLSKPDDLAQYSEVGAALLEGRYALDDGSRTVKGNILITDPMHVLVAAARNPDERTSWLGQLLWLADGDSGPDVPTMEPGDTPECALRTDQRFREALGRVMTYRFNLPDLKPLVIFTDTREAMVRWAGFLREMEPRLPGISGAARNLLTSLTFGLGLMATKSSRITLAGIEAMARFLVGRMANVRMAILHAGELARRRDQITRIFNKLGCGPANARKFCRDLKITAADRDEALRWLEAASLVMQCQDGWQLREGARLSFKDCAVPILEV